MRIIQETDSFLLIKAVAILPAVDNIDWDCISLVLEFRMSDVGRLLRSLCLLQMMSDK